VAAANITMVINLLNVLVEEGKYSFRKVVATCHPENVGSSRALKKAGFSLINEGLLTGYGLRNRYEITMPTIQSEDL
jgi:RimJ/RimL family protein N-acetyltransferase